MATSEDKIKEELKALCSGLEGLPTTFSLRPPLDKNVPHAPKRSTFSKTDLSNSGVQKNLEVVRILSPVF